MATAPRTPKTVKTPEQRREEMEALHARLDAQVETLRTSEGWAAYLKAARSFHRYSLSNLLLIMAQAPKATQVAGYRSWQAKGRQVRKGEKALAILGSRLAPAGPRTDTGEDKAGAESGAEGEQGGRGMRRVFFPVKVFDVSQTDAIEGAPQMPTPTRDLDAEDHAGLYARVAAHFERTGVALRRAIVPGTANGFCRKIPPAGAPLAAEDAWVVEVVVDERRTGADAARTALHEAAHIAADHLENSGGDYVAHRGRIEIEAEGAAYIVAAIAGLDTGPASTGYVASWMGHIETATLKATATAALAAAKVLTAALGLDEQDDQDADEHQAQPIAA